MSPTLKGNPTFLETLLGGYRFIVLAVTVTYQVFLHPNSQSPMTISHHKLIKEKAWFWPMDELIHHPWQYLLTLFIRSVIRKVHRSHIKYHITPQISYLVYLVHLPAMVEASLEVWIRLTQMLFWFIVEGRRSNITLPPLPKSCSRDSYHHQIRVCKYILI